jgi:tetratricopeptide (TPR) repeat protein
MSALPAAGASSWPALGRPGRRCWFHVCAFPFTGRGDELALLAGLLDPAGATGPVVVSAVAGLAGVGKTTLAVQAGHAAVKQGWFGGGVLFIDLHGYDEAPVEPAQALDALLRALGVPAEHIPRGTDERAGLYRSVLAQIGDPVLVIVDNASTEAQVKPLLPGAEPHKVLVTSRHTLAGLSVRLVDVRVMGEQDGVLLLDRAVRAARPGDERISGELEAAARLARFCGGLPLALQIAAALLKADTTRSTGELADDLTAERERLEGLRYGGGGAGTLSVAAAFELSYRRLDETSARVFRLLSLNPGADVSTAVAAVLADLPAREAREILAGLARAHLVEASPAAAGRWQMHDLLRLYALRRCDEDADAREQAYDRLLSYYLDMAGAANAYVRALPGTEVPDKFTSRTDALAWLDAERPNLVGAIALAANSGRDQIATALPLRMYQYLDWRRRFDDLLATITISRDVARSLGDQGDEAMALSILGNALRQMRRFEEAIIAQQEAVSIFRKIGDRYRESAAMNGLGLTLREVGRFEEAVTAHQDAVVIYRETGDRHGEGMAVNNLGLALHAVGRSEEAITAHQDAVAIYQETGDRHREGTAEANLGLALQDVGRSEEAITAHQAAVEAFQETGDRHAEGTVEANLGLALREVGRSEEAITAHQAAVSIFQETGDRDGEGTTLGNLGLALQDVGRSEEAITAHQAAVAAFQEIGHQPGESTVLTALGVALEAVGRFEEAITAQEAAVAAFRETGDRHGEGMALGNLGNALHRVGRFDKAITAHEAGAAAFRETGDTRGENMMLENLELDRAAQRT